jgi:hypothetical protein
MTPRPAILADARGLWVWMVLLAVVCPAPGQTWTNPKAQTAPPATPQRRAGGEGVPPLPLPATPLRRTERKRPPAPPAMVGMINLTVTRTGTGDAELFPTTAIDIDALMKQANNKLGIRYRFLPTTLETFSWDPTDIPLLYITGWTELPELSDSLVGKLRQYLYDGGTLVIHAQCGREEFVTTARREIARILPDRQLAALDTDSPLFDAYFKIRQMRYRKDSDPFKSIPPYIEAVYLGCRPAIIFSPIDLNCGWDVEANPIEGGTLYHQEDARRLGVNLIAFTLADLQYARSWGMEKQFPQQSLPTRDQLVIAQIRHSGDWDPAPEAMVNLLKHLDRNTTINVQFKRDTVDLTDDSLADYPVVVMTGLRDFTFDPDQATRLRTYLKNGGVLIADSAAGKAAFDTAFQREIKNVLPDAALETIPPDDPIYQMPFHLQTTDYTRRHQLQFGAQRTPSLMGVRIDGQWAVIYSPVDLSAAWENLEYPFSKGYEPDDARRLGVNVFTYALTH